MAVAGRGRRAAAGAGLAGPGGGRRLAGLEEGGGWRRRRRAAAGGAGQGRKEERARQRGWSVAAGGEEPMLGCGNRLLAWADLGQIPLAKPTAGLCRRQAVGIGRFIFYFLIFYLLFLFTFLFPHMLTLFISFIFLSLLVIITYNSFLGRNIGVDRAGVAG
jgi:hypothetical protein